MTRVSISELKARLSRFLRALKGSGEVQILDGGRPVARLVATPATTEGSSGDERLERLIREGVIRPGLGDRRAILVMTPLELDVDLRRALDEDREDRF